MRNFLRLERVASAFFFCVFAFALVLGMSPKPVLAQSASTGMIVGVVTDASNAIVPNATVTITLKSTGTSRSTVTDTQGRYVFADVDPGAYDITISKAGFSSTVISNQVVKLGLQLTENAKMQLGSVSTTVTVTETPGAELQTVTPTVGTTLSGAIILNLPNQSRDASTLAILSPGQNINGNTGGESQDENSFQLDGGFATDDMSGDNNTYIHGFGSDTAGGAGAMHTQGNNQTPSAVVPVPVASIEEFKVSTANQTADFNGGGGSQMQLVTKRGTKTLHGSVYEYYLDNNFGGANTWDNNSTGTAQPSSHFSRFGASAGGEIPHSNFLGGNWFIFGNYEGYRFPQNSIFERAFPTATLRTGLMQMDGEVINPNNVATTDPATGKTYAANMVTCVAAKGCDPVTVGSVTTYTYTPGQTFGCGPSGTGTCDPRNLGFNPVLKNLWNTYLPLPNDCNQGDGQNYCGYKGAISTPQSSNFGVARVDHDFAKNWHFNGTYHYYKLQNTVSDQWDVGGFFPGDTKGDYAAVRTKPQEPWLYTAGLTTDVTPNVTNDIHFSYTRNWWAYGDPGGVPNVAGYPAALEVGGENSGAGTTDNPVFIPYNTNNQNVRTRYWDGHDSMYRDDVTWIKGNHLFQMGGTYQRNNDTHERNDNGSFVNTFEQYLIGTSFTSALTNNNIDLSGVTPLGVSSSSADAAKYGELYSIVTGMVDQTQGLYTRSPGSRSTGLPLLPRPTGDCAIAGVAATADCTSSPPLLNTSVIPTYNLYFSDSWHLKPTISLNYGLGYTVQMPPYNTNGGYQTVMVDQNDNILYAMNYLNNERAAALQGNAYAPMIGFSTVDNTNHHNHYPYDPFFGGLAPRVGIAWNVRPDTVVRAGYSRIFGRINGVDPMLVPMLTPGLMQPAVCEGPTMTGTCATTSNLTTAANGFRVGADGVNAPLPAPSASLPQPWYPGFNDVQTGPGETIDPNFTPDRSDEFTLSIQHQFGPKILAEVGYIGRLMSNEGEYYSLTNVPYMMTEGGQTFANAWAQVMQATNFGTNLSSIPVQPFFETALGGAGSNYCTGNFAGGITGLTSCTAEFVRQNAANGNMQGSVPYNAWNGVSSAGFLLFNGNAARSSPSDPIGVTCPTGSTTGIGCQGETPSIDTTVSNGFGNYNAGYLQLTMTDWHGLTTKASFQYSNALGTVNVLQASSAFTTVDPWNLQNMYGPQTYNEKFNFNFFMNYAEPFYKSQQGVIGHLLGGWNFSPLFTYGSGFPVELGTGTGGDNTSFGETNPGYVGSEENGVIMQNLHYSGTRKASAGGVAPDGTPCGNFGPGFNVFSNPAATCPGAGIFGDPIRNPILGFDGQIGGGGPLKGLPFWNLDMGINKNVKITEKFSGTMFFDFTNVLNHMQPNDPALNIFSPGTWGVLGGGGNLQGNLPRQLQLGLSIDW
ncbi:MAG TPA: carboxypeptidase-like regulatory domain-containing protein [Candidatus Acidoferrales bacterium]|nr:carboxypeptidase-like regulatory domain-containing protein [Candidatus Acidoferrales bacterium]